MILHIAVKRSVSMVTCLSLWATGFKLSPLAHAFDKLFNVALGVLQ